MSSSPQRSCLGVWLRFLVSLAHGTDRRTTHRSRKLSGHHHPTRLQSRRGHRSFAGDAYGMDRGQRRTNERTSRQNFGILKGRKQRRVAVLAWMRLCAEPSTAPGRTRGYGCACPYSSFDEASAVIPSRKGDETPSHARPIRVFKSLKRFGHPMAEQYSRNSKVLGSLSVIFWWD